MHPIHQWQGSFLNRRGFHHPTGRPLYTYRVEDQEFSDLETVMRECVGVWLRSVTLGDVARKVACFPPLFVLYAAEWWRRNYDGTGFAWEPIVSAIGASADAWNPTERSECVEKGLQGWRLRLSNAHGLRYLGSIAFQGGLPMRLLASAQGPIGGILKRALKLAGGGGTDAAEILEWIKSLAHFLPNSYRQNEVFVLLTEVVLTILRLKQQANLTIGADVVAELDQAAQGWRDEFPLKIDGHQAIELFKLAIGVPPGEQDHRNQAILVERWLDTADQDCFQLRSEIVLPQFLDSAPLARLFGIEPEKLSRTLTLRFPRGEQTVDVSLRRLAGQDRYRVERRTLERRGDLATAEHTMLLLIATGEAPHKEIARGEALDPELPWMFEQGDDPANPCRLIRQGSGAIAGFEGILCTPQDWDLRPDDGASVDCKGQLSGGTRRVWTIRGGIRIDACDGLHYRVRCGQAAATEDRFELRGQRYWDLFDHPAVAFRGVPELYEVSENGLERLAQGTLAWRVPGGRLTQRPDEIAGPVSAIWPAQGATKWRAHVVLLPAQASMTVEPGADPLSGALRFANWDLVTVNCDTPGVSSHTRIDGASVVLDLRCQGEGHPPEWCSVNAVWRGNPHIVRLRVPFPAKGVRTIAANGTQLEDGALLAVGRVCGTRMTGFLGPGAHQATLRLGLHRGNHAHPVSIVEHTIRANVGGSRVEIRLVDYVNDIQRMLADADTLDAHVSVRLGLPGGEASTLRVARYEFELERLAMVSQLGLPQEHLHRFSAEDIAGWPVVALRIDAPGDEPIRLAPVLSEGVSTGNWMFPSADLSPGAWLIHPGSGSQVAFRPMLWPVLARNEALPARQDAEEAPGLEITLTTALGIPTERQRLDALDAVIAALAQDFISDDWRLVEQLAVQLGHLPLSTLDLWRCFAQSRAGQAALAVRMGGLPAGFAERFPIELPTVWEMIPLTAWVQAMRALITQGTSWYGHEAGALVVSEYLDRRVQALASACPSLRVLLEVARGKATGKINQDLRAAQDPRMDGVFAGQLFNGENSRVQHLLRNNADRQWPSGFAAEVAVARQHGAGPYFCPVNHGFHDSVINLPMLLALNTTMDLHVDWSQHSHLIRKVREVQSFDPEWFAEAFDLTVARCLATGRVDLPPPDVPRLTPRLDDDGRRVFRRAPRGPR
ncbi:MAG: STY4851/ECs_5259 family protein [Accumulibacter sp.]|uniref:STY4851/ECs_5259 family protein n=1 Tax=Accumulibacter sp. TaxID=2053492 RepID=UPI002FC36DD4